jgi:hypothetical protein
MFAGDAHSGQTAVFIQGCTFGSPEGIDVEPTRVNQYVSIAESAFQTVVQDAPATSYSNAGRYVNDAFEGYFLGSGVFFGGQMYNPSHFLVLTDPTFFDDTEIFSTTFISGVQNLTGEGGYSVRSGGGLYLSINAVIEGGYFSIAGQIWGPGQFYANAGAFVSYTTSATATFIQTGAMFIAGSGTACSYSSGLNCGISITPTAIDAPAGVAGFGGTAFSLGGGVITNVSQ